MSDPQTRKLSHYFTHSKRKGRPGLPLASVTMNDGLVLRDDMDRKMDTSLSDEEHSLVEPGDIAYNMMRMWQGAFGLASAPVNVSPAYVVMRAKPTLDPRFAAHWLKSDRALYLLWAFSYGLTDDRLRLYPKEFLQIPVQWPDVAEQRRIAAVLDTWDEAIDAALLATEAKSLRIAATLKAVFAELPETQLEELADLTMGQSPASSSYCESHIQGALPLAGGAADFDSEGGICAQNWTSEPQKIAEPGAVIMSVRAPVGTIAYNAQRVALGRGVCALRPTQFDSPKLLGYLVLSLNRYWWRIKQGGTFEAVNGEDIRQAPIADVRVGNIDLLSKIVTDADALINLERRKISILRDQKRALMQKLLTGQWRVPESIDALLPEALAT